MGDTAFPSSPVMVPVTSPRAEAALLLSSLRVALVGYCRLARGSWHAASADHYLDFGAAPHGFGRRSRVTMFCSSGGNLYLQAKPPKCARLQIAGVDGFKEALDVNGERLPRQAAQTEPG